MITKENYFTELSKIWVELSKKGWLNYSSWADVWSELKKQVPDAIYQWYENEQGTLWFVDDYGAWAKVRVSSEYLWVDVTQHLQVQDFRNQSMKKDKLTSNDINKTYQRCLVKAIATWFGLWLYLYQWEDFPEDEDVNTPKETKAPVKKDFSEPSNTNIAKKTNDYSQLEFMEWIELIKDEKDINHLNVLYTEFMKYKKTETNTRWWSEKQIDWYVRDSAKRKEELTK